MSSGAARRSFEIQSRSRTRGASGGLSGEWQTQAVRRGALLPLSGRESEIAAAAQSQAAYRIEMRAYAGLGSHHRLYEPLTGRTFEIDSQRDVKDRGRWQDVYVFERA